MEKNGSTRTRPTPPNDPNTHPTSNYITKWIRSCANSQKFDLFQKKIREKQQKLFAQHDHEIEMDLSFVVQQIILSCADLKFGNKSNFP